MKDEKWSAQSPQLSPNLCQVKLLKHPKLPRLHQPSQQKSSAVKKPSQQKLPMVHFTRAISSYTVTKRIKSRESMSSKKHSSRVKSNLMNTKSTLLSSAINFRNRTKRGNTLKMSSLIQKNGKRKLNLHYKINQIYGGSNQKS